MLKNWLVGKAAISRIRVFSANGKELTPCKLAKAWKLLKEGKAFIGYDDDAKEPFIFLTFNLTSPIVHPSAESKPEEDSDSLKVEDLIKARERGKRNGMYHKLKKHGKWVEKGLLDASIEYLKMGCRIVNPKVKEALEAVMDFLEKPGGPVSRRRILKKGREKAAELADKLLKIISWAPQLLNWLKSQSYMVWLGVTQINPGGYAHYSGKAATDNLRN